MESVLDIVGLQSGMGEQGGGREQASGIVDIFIVLERGERGRRENKEERNKIKG